MVEEEKPKRKRNKIYRVVRPDKLTAFRPVTAEALKPLPVSVEARLSSLEKEMQQFKPLAEMLTNLMKLNKVGGKQ